MDRMTFFFLDKYITSVSLKSTSSLQVYFTEIFVSLITGFLDHCCEASFLG